MDSKADIKLMKKLSEAQTIISIEDKQFLLNEMSIGRVRNFGIQLIRIVDKISKLSGKDISEMEMSDMLQSYGDIIFAEITEILNWIFCYKNSDYVELTKEWVDENISIRILTEIIKEIARQNQLSWLIPFFQERFNKALKAMEG